MFYTVDGLDWVQVHVPGWRCCLGLQAAEWGALRDNLGDTQLIQERYIGHYMHDTSKLEAVSNI